MKPRYRKFRRGQVWYYQDTETGKQLSLRTRDELEADALLLAMNEAEREPRLNKQRAKMYLEASDPKALIRTWDDAIESYYQRPMKKQSLNRCRRAFEHEDFDPLRNTKLIDTTADDLIAIIAHASIASVHYLKRVHNHALDLQWIYNPILPKQFWPKSTTKDRRAITAEEHQKIIASENNLERKLYYSLLWETGASQSDAAELTAESIDETSGCLVYQRKKLQDDAPPCRMRISRNLQDILDQLPERGSLFPRIWIIDPRRQPIDGRGRDFAVAVKTKIRITHIISENEDYV